MKDTFYFSHDYNSKKDPKCSALMAEYGPEGYGIYWALIEIMHEQGGKLKKFPKLYNGLAYQFFIEAKKFASIFDAMINDFELFKQNENYIWSDRVLKNFEDRENKKLAKQEAGRLGGIRSGEARRSKTKQDFEANEANEAKERKGKERKGKDIKEKNIKKEKYLDVVFLEKIEEEKLIEKLGIEKTNEYIEKLNNYIQSKGIKYKSHYHTILTWSRKEEKPQELSTNMQAMVAIEQSKRNRTENINMPGIAYADFSL